MRRIFLPSIILLTAIAITALPVKARTHNHPPFICNIQAEQRPGAKMMGIIYDVNDPDGDLLDIIVAVSYDGGHTFTAADGKLAGDIGTGITPGPGNQISWNTEVNAPDVYGKNHRVKITANDGQASGEVIVEPSGTPMALIPAGEFQMGDAFAEGKLNERLVHTIYLDAFYLDVYDVTNAQYAAFLNEYGKNTDDAGHELLNISGRYCLIEKAGNIYRPKAGYENHPVIEVSWYGASAYAKFYGKRLPTEAEWEKAAQGGLVRREYACKEDVSHDYANYAGTAGKDEWYRTAPVNSFAPNGYGLYNMVGNVQDWCADWYATDYYAGSPKQNPQGPDSGHFRVVRGGGWYVTDPQHLSLASRSGRPPLDTLTYVGFRCASTP